VEILKHSSPKPSLSVLTPLKTRCGEKFKDRFVNHAGAPVAIVDVGSNSVRLVVYECLGRSPRPIFNEKSLCALGKGIATLENFRRAALKRRSRLCAVSGS